MSRRISAHRFFVRSAPALLAALALTLLVGCSSGPRHDPLCGCAPTCLPSGCGALPSDMPRDPEIRYTGEFAKLVGEVSHALREGHS